jgi:hypothetical protein
MTLTPFEIEVGAAIVGGSLVTLSIFAGRIVFRLGWRGLLKLRENSNLSDLRYVDTYAKDVSGCIIAILSLNAAYVSASVLCLMAIFLSYSNTFTWPLSRPSVELTRGLLAGIESAFSILNVRYTGLLAQAAFDRPKLVSELRKRAKLPPEEAAPLPDTDR